MFKGHDPEVLASATATAVGSLSNVVASSTAAGHWEVAKAGNEAQQVIINVVVQNADPTPAQITELDERLTRLETSVEQRGVPHTQQFKCIEDYKACLADADDDNGRWLCRLGLAACSALTLLALRDRATKVGHLRLETAPPRLVLERAWPGRTLELRPGELKAIGLVSLGEDPDAGDAGYRQLLFGVPGEREVRSYLEPDVAAAERLAESVAATFELELERFTGPPQRR